MPVNIDPTMRNNLLYSLDDPQQSFDNAMHASGINIYRSNPYVNMMRKAAPGLGVAYATDMARTGPYGNPDGKPGMNDYGTYLRNAIQGVPGESISARLGGTGDPNNFRQTVSMVRDYQDRQNSGVGGADFNPYLAYLNDLYGSDNGKGLTDAMFAVRAPMLGGTGLARAYRTGLDQSYNTGYRNLVQGGDVNDDVWKYILNF